LTIWAGKDSEVNLAAHIQLYIATTGEPGVW